jgi:hypothetical protein
MGHTYSYMLEQGLTMIIGATIVHLDFYFSTIFSKNILEIYSIHHLEKENFQNFVNTIMLRFIFFEIQTYINMLCVFIFNYCLKTLVT